MVRRALILASIAAAPACEPGGVTRSQEVCARATAMYEKCERIDATDKLARDLELDRWRSLCRAVLTGETQQLLPDALAIFQDLDDGSRLGLREQALCTADAKTCEAYAACSK